MHQNLAGSFRESLDILGSRFLRMHSGFGILAQEHGMKMSLVELRWVRKNLSTSTKLHSERGG
jgi:hypothetical protein